MTRVRARLLAVAVAVIALLLPVALMARNRAASATTAALRAYYLADYNAVERYFINYVDTAPRKVNGVTYYHPVAWPAGFADKPFYAGWDLSRKCVWFTSPGTGISDDAPSDSRYVFTVSADGSDRWRREIRLGQRYGIRLAINNALRIRLAVASREGFGVAVWGDARVWCYSPPPNKKQGGPKAGVTLGRSF